ncbi:hypothetical protein [Tahibacter amnicola]|uniref:SH3 domain-containing protein n=1 Tax=Tahibacter amnicola TaxID=2976241 RepID=A0ABY6B975_9GAMM|nr:hypothetical protein [Tahibacter amnicola]UXI66621.1 hypothetical protein N4264_17945 [Tahibacter amnicola]
MRKRSSRVLVVLLSLGLAACQALPSRQSAVTPSSVPAELAGEYDNHAERWSASEGGRAPPVATSTPAIHHWLSHPGGDAGMLLWRTVLPDTSPVKEGRWLLLRNERNGYVPYRPLTAEAEAVFQAKNAGRIAVDDKNWAPLQACTLKPAASRNGLAFAADPTACSALLPGIGAAGALLPLRFELINDRLRVVTVADQARGVDAATLSQRVRWFTGWDALNGGGAKASPENNDWHLNRDLRLHTEGGRVPLRFRDGAASGYTLELARLTYRESGTEVLRLGIVEDATGKTISYVWADPQARRIGLNLGWIQVGLEEEGLSKDPRSR